MKTLCPRCGCDAFRCSLGERHGSRLISREKRHA